MVSGGRPEVYYPGGNRGDLASRRAIRSMAREAGVPISDVTPQDLQQDVRDSIRQQMIDAGIDPDEAARVTGPGLTVPVGPTEPPNGPPEAQ